LNFKPLPHAHLQSSEARVDITARPHLYLVMNINIVAT